MANFQLTPHHVGIFVSDIQASIKWYEEMLGFKLRRQRVRDLPLAGPTKMAFLYNGDFCIELHDKPKAAPFSWETYQNTHGTKHISFLVENFSELVAFLKKKGVKFMVEHHWPARQDEGQREGTNVAYIFDNSGIPIELQDS